MTRVSDPIVGCPNPDTETVSGLSGSVYVIIHGKVEGADLCPAPDSQ
jgi:hypothetical protein